VARCRIIRYDQHAAGNEPARDEGIAWMVRQTTPRPNNTRTVV
jgi:hypothetical protein